jgi:hypothetical protein
MKQAAGLATTLIAFNIDVEKRHQELVELITSRSDSIDNLSSVSIFHLFLCCSKIIFIRLDELH